MYRLLVIAMVMSAITQLNLSKVAGCKNRECLTRIEKASHKVTEIRWRPISVFPEEAARFNKR